MVEQVAYYVRGGLVHGEDSCVTRSRRVTLTDQHLPVRQDGRRTIWFPCHKCGTPLLTTLATTSTFRTGVWLVATRPTSEAAAGWRVREGGENAVRLRALAEHCDLQVIEQAASGGTTWTMRPERNPVTVLGLLPWAVVDVLGPRYRVQALPERALTQRLDDPVRFAAVADVFARLAAGSQISAAIQERQGSALWWDTIRRHGEDLWMAAEAVAEPALLT